MAERTRLQDSRFQGAASALEAARVSCHVSAPRTIVYCALLDPRAIARWMVPEPGVVAGTFAFLPFEGKVSESEMRHTGRQARQRRNVALAERNWIVPGMAADVRDESNAERQ